MVIDTENARQSIWIRRDVVVAGKLRRAERQLLGHLDDGALDVYLRAGLAMSAVLLSTCTVFRRGLISPYKFQRVVARAVGDLVGGSTPMAKSAVASA